MKPGYTIHSDCISDIESGGSSDGAGKSVVIRRTVEVERVSEELDGTLRQAVPIMPRTLAVMCLVMNVLSPGLGQYIIFYTLSDLKTYFK